MSNMIYILSGISGGAEYRTILTAGNAKEAVNYANDILGDIGWRVEKVFDANPPSGSVIMVSDLPLPNNYSPAPMIDTWRFRNFS